MIEQEPEQEQEQAEAQAKTELHVQHRQSRWDGTRP
jgi:hypothetical protein